MIEPFQASLVQSPSIRKRRARPVTLTLRPSAAYLKPHRLSYLLRLSFCANRSSVIYIGMCRARDEPGQGGSILANLEPAAPPLTT